MAGHRVEAQRDIIAELADVWIVLADIDRYAKVLRSVEAIERIEGQGFDVGVSWREHRRFVGRVESHVLTVTLVDPARRAVIESESGGTLYRTEFTLQPSSVGTRLRVEFAAETRDASALQRMAWTVFGSMGAKATKKALDDDLADFARAVEDRVGR